MAKLRVTVQLRGREVTIRNLRHVNRQVVKRADSSTWNAAQHLKARSQAVVPYQYGVLYSAAYLEKDTDNEDVKMWAVGYDTGKAPHAWPVHEIPGRFHPIRGPSSEPKQDHFLSEPADAMRKEFPRTVANDLRGEIRSIRVIRQRR